MKKRLKHHADAILGILTGYQMIGMYDYFSTHGIGRYEYDYRKNELRFEGNIASAPPILLWIHEWYLNEIKKHNIKSNLLSDTMIKIDIYKRSSQIAVDEKNFIFLTYYVDRAVPTYMAKYDVIIKTASDDYSKSSVGEIN